MTGSVALDVVIGLVFIYLLYSLLTSLIAEIIATNLGLRARNLHSALCRMLDDEKVSALLKSKDLSGIVNKVYEHPAIKSLAPNRVFSKPSSIPADAFVSALVDTLKHGNSDQNLNDLKAGIKSYKLPIAIENYMLNLANEAGSDLSKFSDAVSTWFDNTMHSAGEWYKRNMQIVLFIIGLFIAWGFNVNTISTAEKLAVDKDARGQLVQLASSYIESKDNQGTFDSIRQMGSSEDSLYNLKMDSLLVIKDALLRDISSAQSIIGGGTWLPDSIFYNSNGKWDTPEYINSSLLPVLGKGQTSGYRQFEFVDKFWYALKMLWTNLLGYLITAIALSLGAPFWFDILNKLMKLKSAVSPKSK